MRSTLVAMLMAVGCYRPAPPEGAPCGTDGVCPSGLACDNGLCVSQPTTVDADTGGSGDGNVAIDGPSVLPPDAACGVCSDSTHFAPCTGPAVTCSLGCITTGGDHCARIVPANGVDPSLTATTTDVTVTGGIATFDTGTGAITGAITRAAGTGIDAGIRFEHATSGGAAMGVFAFASLTIASGSEVHFTGSPSAVFLAEGTISVAGRIDLSGGCYGSERSCAGPGGGSGSTMGAAASGGCAGANGASSTSNADDGGGGGGGGGESGRGGGSASMAAAGAGGSACLSAALVPLRGGGGGGAGGPGASEFPVGGGGGGALQLTSQTSIQIAGEIIAAGAGGSGGHTQDGSSASAASGGGGGGGVLLEAPTVQVTAQGTIAANGGGGGGGGNSGVGPGSAGEDGGLTATPAAGGMGTASPGPANGGSGGAGAQSPTVGGAGTNGGGGGGGRGVVRVRANTPTLNGLLSPGATTVPVVTD